MNLTQTAALTRKLVFIFVTLIILGSTSFVGYKIWYASYLAKLPPKQEKPDATFGILPPPNFPNTSVSSSNFSYSIATTDGKLPKFDSLAKVFFVTKPAATFLASDKVKALANKFNFTNDPEILTDTSYRFKDNNRTFTIDLDTGNFFYTNQASKSATTRSDSNDAVIKKFKDFLNSVGILNDSLKNGRGKVFGNDDQSFSISLWQADIDKKTVVTENPNQALISAKLLGSPAQLDNYISLNYTFWPIDTTTFSTYPIKTVDQAFSELQNGKGIVVLKPSNPQVAISSVSLAYYLATDYSPYLEPVFVFEGPSFVAYIPAITDQFTSK